MFRAHRDVYHSTPGLRVIKKKRKIPGPSNKEEEKKFGVQEVRGSVSDFERTGHMQNSHGQSMALALGPQPFNPFKSFPLRSASTLEARGASQPVP